MAVVELNSGKDLATDSLSEGPNICTQMMVARFYVDPTTKTGAAPTAPERPTEAPASSAEAFPTSPRTGDDCADGLISPDQFLCGTSPGTERNVYWCHDRAWVETVCTEGCMPNGGADYCY